MAPHVKYSIVQTSMETMVVQALPSSLLLEKSVYQAACCRLPPVEQTGFRSVQIFHTACAWWTWAAPV